MVGEPEVERGSVHAFEQPSSRACYDGPDPEAELVDEVVSHEGVIEVAGAVLDEILAGRAFSCAIALDGSGPSSVAFRFVSVSVRDATYFGMALIRSI